MYNMDDRYVNKLLQMSINSRLHIVLRYIEEGTLAVKMGSVMVIVLPGRSNLSVESEQVNGSLSSM